MLTGVLNGQESVWVSISDRMIPQAVSPDTSVFSFDLRSFFAEDRGSGVVFCSFSGESVVIRKD